MSSHTNSSFLNSCIKVPIDPCNRCPAPTFGRPLIYYGKDKECSKRKKKCKKKMLSGCESERKTKEALHNLTTFYHSIPDYAEINHLPKDEFYNTLDRLKTACEKISTQNVDFESCPSSDSCKRKKKNTKKHKRPKSRTSCLGPEIKGYKRIEDKPLKFDSYKAFRDHITRKELQNRESAQKNLEQKYESYKSFRERVDQKIRFDDELNVEDEASDNQEASICGDDCKFNKQADLDSLRDHFPTEIVKKDDLDTTRVLNYVDSHSKSNCRLSKQADFNCEDSNTTRIHNYSDSHSKNDCRLSKQADFNCEDSNTTRIHNFSDSHPKEHCKFKNEQDFDTTRNNNYSDPHPKDYSSYKSFREDLEKMFESNLEKNFLDYKHESSKMDLPHKTFRIEQNDELLSVFEEDLPDEPINIINEEEIIRKYNKYFENIPSSPKVEKKKSLSVNDLREDVENKLTLKEKSKDLKVESLKHSFTSCHIEKSRPKVTMEVLPPSPLKTKQSAFVSPFSLLLPKKQKKRPISASPVYPVARPNLAATLRKEISKKKLQDLDNHCTFRDTNTPQVDWEVRKTPAWKTLNLSESHKNILSLRLATRKAEQKRQESEYELQMLMMKQRVKSAPLLLEGPTHWGPHVGKLTHSCHKDNSFHQCPNNRSKKKRTGSGSSKQRAMMPLPPPTRKIISSCSINSTNLNDSDDLCSLDRAYL